MSEETLPRGIQPSGREVFPHIGFLARREYEAAVLHCNVFRAVVLQLIVAAAVAVHLDVPVVGVEGGAVEIIGPDQLVAVGLAASFLSGRGCGQLIPVFTVVHDKVRRKIVRGALAGHRHESGEQDCGKSFFHKLKVKKVRPPGSGRDP